MSLHSGLTVKVTDRIPRGSRGAALFFLDLSAIRGGWSAPRPGCFTPGKDPVPLVQENRWAPGPVWTCVKNLAPTGIPSRSQSLYRLNYPGLNRFNGAFIIFLRSVINEWAGLRLNNEVQFIIGLLKKVHFYTR
jgi:hypothetical protein